MGLLPTDHKYFGSVSSCGHAQSAPTEFKESFMNWKLSICSSAFTEWTRVFGASHAWAQNEIRHWTDACTVCLHSHPLIEWKKERSSKQTPECLYYKTKIPWQSPYYTCFLKYQHYGKWLSVQFIQVIPSLNSKDVYWGIHLLSFTNLA